MAAALQIHVYTVYILLRTHICIAQRKRIQLTLLDGIQIKVKHDNNQEKKRQEKETKNGEFRAGQFRTDSRKKRQTLPHYCSLQDAIITIVFGPILWVG